MKINQLTKVVAYHIIYVYGRCANICISNDCITTKIA